jgi:cell division protein FtsI (penicillin-binding protein 3)
MVSEKQANRRIRLLFVVFALLFGATLARAGWLQVVKAAQFSRMAIRQHEHTVTVPAWRGTIFDAGGADLALGVQTTTVFADPTVLRQPRAVAVAAGKLLGVDPNTLYPQLLNRRASSTSPVRRPRTVLEALAGLRRRLVRRRSGDTQRSVRR